MKVTTRINLGFGILMAGLVAFSVAHVIAVRHLETLAEATSGIELRAARTSLQLMRDRDLLEQNLRRHFVQEEDSTASEIELLRDSFQAGLRELQANVKSEAELRETARLAEFWMRFLQDLAGAQSARKTGTRSELPALLVEHLARLDTQVGTVYQANLESITTLVERSRTSSQRTERLSWVIVAAVWVMGALTWILIARSIYIPLSSLLEGTKALVEGKSFVRLDTSRADELAQIAKSFNTIVERSDPRAHRQ